MLSPETPDQSSRKLQTIHLSDVTELQGFEDALTLEIEPTITGKELLTWAGRTALRDLIRPPKFNGSIQDITLKEMENPYDLLLSARERGLKFSTAGKIFHARTSDASIERTTEHAKGYIFTADACSSGRGVIGKIATEIWYLPALLAFDNRGHRTHNTSSLKSGQPIIRYVAVPEIRRDLPPTSRTQ